MGMYVLSGELAVGKTKLLGILENRGYCCYPELEQLASNECNGSDGARKNPVRYARRWFIDKLNQYNSAVNNNELSFFDRSIFDPLSIFLFLGMEIPKDLKQKADYVNYDSVFFLDPIPEKWYGGVWPRRILSKDESKAFGNVLRGFYERNGYNIISVPPMTVNERADFIFSHI